MGTNALFNQPTGVAVDADGNVFVADWGNRAVRLIDGKGNVTTYAGSLTGATGTTDATGTNALFSAVFNLALDVEEGTVYVTDNNCFRKIDASRAVTAFSGVPYGQGNVDAVGTLARFNNPVGLVISSDGILYMTDKYNSNIRKIFTSNASVTTFAGSRTSTSGHADAMGTSATFHDLSGLALDAFGVLYVADQGNNMIRTVTPDGNVTTLAGYTVAGSTDGVGTNARFNSPASVVVDANGTVFVSDAANREIRMINADRNVTTFAGRLSVPAGFTDGHGTSALFSSPSRMCFDAAGNLIVLDMLGHTIRKITMDGDVTTLAGLGGTSGYADGVGSEALFKFPTGIALHPSGDFIVADSLNAAIRRVTPEGSVTTIAGKVGTAGFDYVNDVGSNARFSSPNSIAIDADGVIYVTDSGNQAIRRITLRD